MGPPLKDLSCLQALHCEAVSAFRRASLCQGTELGGKGETKGVWILPPEGSQLF